MEIFNLIDKVGQTKIYRGFKVKPQINDLIRIPYIPKDTKHLVPNRKNTFKHVSTEKVYKVYKVVNVNQILIRDDQDDSVHLLNGQYQVVEEISDKEIELYKQNREMLVMIDKLIKSKNK
ncbi:hypothetical protein [Lysinibacillus sp. RC79]|uniref:hypothetical protein n=1 Tax=Lysinibacillus sp. RC79 TaxID=3156296 RepID=UPI00351392FE